VKFLRSVTAAEERVFLLQSTLNPDYYS